MLQKTTAEHGKPGPKMYKPCFLKQEKIIQFILTSASFYNELTLNKLSF